MEVCYLLGMSGSTGRMTEFNVREFICRLEHIRLMTEAICKNDVAALVCKVRRCFVALIALGDVSLENYLRIAESESFLCLFCGVHEVLVIGGVFVVKEYKAYLYIRLIESVRTLVFGICAVFSVFAVCGIT